MLLTSLYEWPDMWWLPYRLLDEREAHENISHRTMPSLQDHEEFVRSRPYDVWYWFADAHGEPAGCIYLTKQNEIGIGVLKAYRGKGLAESAIAELMRLHPRDRYLANIALGNDKSVALFRKFGFSPLQITLEKRA